MAKGSESSGEGSVLKRIRSVDRGAAEQAVRDLLGALGFDVDLPALATTPAKTAEAFIDALTSGYDVVAEEVLGRGFPVASDGPVVATDIPFLFVCPHHLTCAAAVAHVGFVPTDRAPGLSRIARLVDVLGRRLVLQEDLTEHIVETLERAIGAKAAIAVVEARHTCVALEDFARRDTLFTTRATRGPEALVALMQTLIDSRVRTARVDH